MVAKVAVRYVLSNVFPCTRMLRDFYIRKWIKRLVLIAFVRESMPCSSSR